MTKKTATKSKKKKSTQQDKSVDVLDIIETEEAKRKEEKKEEVKPSKSPKVEAPDKKKPSTGMKKGMPIKDTTDQLPKLAQDRKIVCKQVTEVGISRIDITDITSTSKQIYVDNIHSANPQILQTIYWIICPDTRHVVVRVEKDEYNYVLKTSGKTAVHHISVVDCAVMPTLTYGSWKVDEVKGELPSPQQIEEKDEAFKKNPTNFHNPPVKVELYEAQQEAEKAIKEASASKEDTQEEEDFDFDFSDEEEEDNEEENEEEDFDFDFED